MKILIKLFLVLTVIFSFPIAQAKDCRKMPTQVEMNICLKEKLIVLDQKLAGILADLLSNPSYSNQKVKVQFDTLKLYRESFCEFASERYQGGTFRPASYGYCYVDMTELWIDQLSL